MDLREVTTGDDLPERNTANHQGQLGWQNANALTPDTWLTF
jgi:hypothetical protein